MSKFTINYDVPVNPKKKNKIIRWYSKENHCDSHCQNSATACYCCEVDNDCDCVETIEIEKLRPYFDQRVCFSQGHYSSEEERESQSKTVGHCCPTIKQVIDSFRI